MTTMLEPAPATEPETLAIAGTSEETSKDWAEELRGNVVAIELNVHSFGRTRKIDRSHGDAVAEMLESDREAVRTSKRLYPKNNQCVKEVVAILGRAKGLWLMMTISYKKGIRLLLSLIHI